MVESVGAYSLAANQVSDKLPNELFVVNSVGEAHRVEGRVFEKALRASIALPAFILRVCGQQARYGREDSLEETSYLHLSSEAEQQISGWRKVADQSAAYENFLLSALYEGAEAATYSSAASRAVIVERYVARVNAVFN